MSARTKRIKRLKKTIKLSAAAMSIGAGVLAYNTIKTGKKKSGWNPTVEDERLAKKLSRMVQVETVSGPEEDMGKFDHFHDVLKELFPTVHERLELVNLDQNLLFVWRGKGSERPLVLMAHQDVVPASGEWKHEPYSGDIADGKVWGRGTADTKCSMMAILESAEELLQEGFVPAQDVYLSFGCTEEWDGPGCGKLVSFLEERGVKPFLVCDEGGGIIAEPMAGIDGNFAMVGLFEKGKADVKFTARSNGGHASAPGKDGPVDRIAAFIQDVKSHETFRSEFEPEVKDMFASLAPYAPLYMRVLFSNFKVFEPVLKKVLPAVSSQAGAMLKTTIAFTMLSGSDACNVIPEEASVCANLRFIPHQPMEESLKILEKLAAKHGLEMEVLHASDYTKQVDRNGDAWKLTEETIQEAFPDLPVVPYVVTGATDARNYQRICDACVRFSPVIYGPEQMKGMHGLNENLEVRCLRPAVDFYKLLVRKMY